MPKPDFFLGFIWSHLKFGASFFLHWILGGGFNFCFFHPYLGEWSNLTNIFQMGWNHQLGPGCNHHENHKNQWLPELPPVLQVENWVQPKPVYMKRTKLQIEVTWHFWTKKWGNFWPWKKHILRRSRWWFQVLFIFTPNFGEDSNFDNFFFSKGLKPPTRLGQLIGPLKKKTTS